MGLERVFENRVMSIEFVFKKTTELSSREQKQIRALFSRVFKVEMSEGVFERRFLYSCKGYSYHGLMLHEGDIVGSFTAIPYRYTYFDRELTFALSVDTMISPQPYRTTPLSLDAALSELKKNSGKQFDPELVEVFSTLITG